MLKKIEIKSFGKTSDKIEAKLFILRNSTGAEVCITDYGATITSLKMPDRNGQIADIVLGFDSIKGYVSEEYLQLNPYFGATIGRYANRIGGAKFSLGGLEYRLAANDGSNNLHGGDRGFDKVFWKGRNVSSEKITAVEFSYFSMNGEEGFPGNLTAKVIYSLTEDNDLKIEYCADADQETIVGMTHHSYFNLAGHDSGNALSQFLQINADKFTPISSGSIPLGKIEEVAATPFDFRRFKEIGSDIDAADEQLYFGNGYDHNFVLNGKSGQLRSAAVAADLRTGRVLEVWTTEPCIQLFTGNSLDGSLVGKSGVIYRQHAGFCLEPQHYPDSPNNPSFPSTVLKPGQIYHSCTVYKFSVKL